MSYTKPDLLQDLADMGLTGQETILKHYGQGHKRQTEKRGLLTTSKG